MDPLFAQEDYLRRLKHAYVVGDLTIEELDCRTDHVLRGGHLDIRCEPIDEPDRGSALAAEYRRAVRNGRAGSLPRVPGDEVGCGDCFTVESCADTGCLATGGIPTRGRKE